MFGLHRSDALVVCSAVLASLGPSAVAAAETVKDVRMKMGSRFEVTAIHADERQAQVAIDQAYAEIDRLESMISGWQPTSMTSEINRLAGQSPVVVPEELFNLVRRTLKLSLLTGGAFDITFAAVGGLWDFKTETPTLPEPVAIQQALTHVGFGKIQLDPEASSVYLEDPEARIGFGAIGKGYAANRAVFVLKENGIEDGVVSAGGDLVAFGRREDGRLWDIGIAHPKHRDQIFAQAVVTSGDYESFIVVEGVRYSHILDPRTGYPLAHLRSVTVVCPDAELADGLATAVFVLGPQEGMRLVNSLRGVEALMVDSAGELLFSEGLKSQLLYDKQETSEAS